MQRNFSTEAIVLKNLRVAEADKLVTLLTKDRGILQAFCYGAYKTKGKLRVLSSPFCYSLCSLYFNPVKSVWKITDMSALCFFNSFRDNLDKFLKASFWAELLIKSFAGGSLGPEYFLLLRDALTALDQQKEDFYGVSAQFLWRWICLNGFQPDLTQCSLCQALFVNADPVYYQDASTCFVCSQCTKSLPNHSALNSGARAYLLFTIQKDFFSAIKIRMQENSRRSLQNMLHCLIRTHIAVPMHTFPMIKELL